MIFGKQPQAIEPHYSKKSRICAKIHPESAWEKFRRKVILRADHGGCFLGRHYGMNRFCSQTMRLLVCLTPWFLFLSGPRLQARTELRYRQIHLDFHTSEHIASVGAQFDAEAFAATLARAHMDSVPYFGHCEFILPQLKGHQRICLSYAT